MYSFFFIDSARDIIFHPKNLDWSLWNCRKVNHGNLAIYKCRDLNSFLKLGGQITMRRAAAARPRLLFCQNVGGAIAPLAPPPLLRSLLRIWLFQNSFKKAKFTNTSYTGLILKKKKISKSQLHLQEFRFRIIWRFWIHCLLILILAKACTEFTWHLDKSWWQRTNLLIISDFKL